MIFYTKVIFHTTSDVDKLISILNIFCHEYIKFVAWNLFF